MIREDISGVVGKAGELWVAGTLLLQGTKEGYRVFQAVGDEGVDLFLGKYVSDGIRVEAYLQVKTCASIQNSQAVYTIRDGKLEDDKVYIFLYVPDGIVKWCWVMKGKDAKTVLGSNNQIRLSVSENASDKGSAFRCEPGELLERVKKAIG